MKESELYIKDGDLIVTNFAPPPPSNFIIFDLKIDESGVEYKGERIEDAGKVYRALCQMLGDQGYRV